jgi:hypothetical protein
MMTLGEEGFESGQESRRFLVLVWLQVEVSADLEKDIIFIWQA